METKIEKVKRMAVLRQLQRKLEEDIAKTESAIEDYLSDPITATDDGAAQSLINLFDDGKRKRHRLGDVLLELQELRMPFYNR